MFAILTAQHHYQPLIDRLIERDMLIQKYLFPSPWVYREGTGFFEGVREDIVQVFGPPDRSEDRESFEAWITWLGLKVFNQDSVLCVYDDMSAGLASRDDFRCLDGVWKICEYPREVDVWTYLNGRFYHVG